MQNYRDPPPYPGHSKQVYTNQPGFRQSFSGSETSTDVSLSSTENLAISQRQEPQGEETQTSFNYHLDLGNTEGSGYSILERLGMPPGVIDPTGKYSGSNILNASASTFHQGRSLQQNQASAISTSNSLGLPACPSPLYAKGNFTFGQWQLGNSTHLQQNDITACLGEYISSSQSETQSLNSLLSSTPIASTISREAAGCYSSSRTSSGSGVIGASSGLLPSVLPASSGHQYLSPRVPAVSTYHHPHPYVNTHWTEGSGDSSSSSHSSYLGYHNPSSVTYSQSGTSNTGGGGGTISYSNHDQSHSYPSYLPPPPKYPGGLKDSSSIQGKKVDIWTSRSYEAMDKVDVTGSNPDMRSYASSPGIYTDDAKFKSPHRSANNSADDSDQASIAAKANQMVEMLAGENRALREELALTSIKVAKLQKFEMEIQKVHESHEALVKSSQKQEALWMAMKRKLELKIQSLEAQKLSGGHCPATGPASDSHSRIRLAEKDAMISKLLSQNQELSSTRYQLEGEHAQLNVSVSEQRSHVDILENALLNAQSKIMSLEEEYHKKQMYIAKVEQLQTALKTLQSASDKQEKKEKDLRTHLEKELEMYRAQERDVATKKPDLAKEDVKSTGTLRKLLNEKDARILQLEADLAGMEQKYVREITLRGLELEHVSQAPKEVRLAALEKNSSDMGKLIDEAKTEKLKHMEELHQSQKNVAELEAEVKQLQTQLVEKEAMLKVFQRSPLAMARSSSLHALCHSPLHSPHGSHISPHGWAGSTQVSESSTTGSYREFATIRHVKTGSSSAVDFEHKKSMEEDLLSKVQNLATESKRDSDDECKLFHV